MMLRHSRREFKKLRIQTIGDNRIGKRCATFEELPEKRHAHSHSEALLLVYEVFTRRPKASALPGQRRSRQFTALNTTAAEEMERCTAETSVEAPKLLASVVVFPCAPQVPLFLMETAAVIECLGGGTE